MTSNNIRSTRPRRHLLRDAGAILERPHGKSNVALQPGPTINRGIISASSIDHNRREMVILRFLSLRAGVTRLALSARVSCNSL